MKRHLTILLCICIGTLELIAQPTTFNYQAVVRDTDGNLITNHDIQLRIEILDDEQNIHYAEIHNIQTNEFGQVSLAIGNGIPQEGDFANIPWSDHQLILSTSISLDQGATFTEMGQAPLLSVPYALFAASGNQGPPGNGIDYVESIGDTALIFHFTDGSSYTTTSIVGADGQEGVGITSTVDNGDGTFTFNYSDGSSFTTSDLTGPVVSGENMQTLRHDGSIWVATDALKTDGENVGIGTDPAISRLLVHGDSLAGDDDPIFEVKTKTVMWYSPFTKTVWKSMWMKAHRPKALKEVLPWVD